MFCCGDYILHLGRHEVYTFARICIFRSRLRLSLKNTNLLFYCFIFVLRRCCTSYYNMPISFRRRGRRPRRPEKTSPKPPNEIPINQTPNTTQIKKQAMPAATRWPSLTYPSRIKYFSFQKFLKRGRDFKEVAGGGTFFKKSLPASFHSINMQYPVRA